MEGLGGGAGVRGIDLRVGCILEGQEGEGGGGEGEWEGEGEGRRWDEDCGGRRERAHTARREQVLEGGNRVEEERCEKAKRKTRQPGSAASSWRSAGRKHSSKTRQPDSGVGCNT